MSANVDQRLLEDIKKQIRKSKQTKSSLSFESRKTVEGLIFMIPYMIGLIVFLIIPLVMAFKISVSEPKLSDLLGGDFVGIKNYIEVIQDPTQGQAMIEALGSSFLKVPIIVVFSLFVAVLLKQNFPGRIYYRVIFFIPVILAGVIMSYLFADNVGSISVFSELTSANQTYNIFTEFIGYEAISQIGTVMWKCSVEILIFLAALQSVPAILYEVVELDGASAWESFWHVTLPYISPFVILNFIYAAVDALVDANNPVMSLLQELAKDKYGVAGALSLLYMLVALVVILLFIVLTRRWLK